MQSALLCCFNIIFILPNFYKLFYLFLNFAERQPNQAQAEWSILAHVNTVNYNWTDCHYFQAFKGKK